MSPAATVLFTLYILNLLYTLGFSFLMVYHHAELRSLRDRIGRLEQRRDKAEASAPRLGRNPLQ